MPEPPDPIRRGAAFMLLAAAAFAVMGLLVKYASGLGVPTVQIVAWRSAFTAVAMFVAARRAGVSLRPINPRMHLVRGLVGVGSMGLYFTAIGRLPLGDAVLLTYLSPLLVAAMSPWVAGERPSGRIWLALGIGVLGVASVVGPVGSTDPIGVGFALLAAFFSADAYLAIRVLSRTDPPLTIVFWFSVTGTLVGGLSFFAGPVALDPIRLAVLLGLGVFGTLGQWAMTRAYAAAPAAQVSVYSYATPVFAYLAGLALGEVPHAWSVAGGGLVVLAGWIAAA